MEVRDDTVWDGATAVATLVPSPKGGGAVIVQLTVPAVLDHAVAEQLVDAVTAARVPVLDLSDELARDAARRTGWSGPLRGLLAAPTEGSRPADTTAMVAELLPGVDVTRGGFSRRTLSLRATAPDGLRLKVKVPDRADVMPEMLAGALDVALSVRRRFGRMASGVHTIAIDDGAGMFDDHSTLGSASAGTGTFFLDTSLACVEQMDAQRRRMAGRSGVSAKPPRPWFAIDGVVAHEYWHNLDTTIVATPSVYFELNRALGAELGVETFEHALRGRESGAPPEWQLAFARIVSEVSPYATANMREATAEMFKLWWCRPDDQPPAPLIAAFGAQLDRFYPPPG